MTIKAFLAGTAAATAICFFAWLAIITATDPLKAGIVGFILFYFSLFLWLSGVFLLAGFYLRMAVRPNAIPFTLIAVSSRQAVFLSLFANALLVLKGLKILNLLNASFLLIAVIFIEAYFSNFDYGNLRRNK
ncbi:hypothetical protein KKG29_02670 [Patescibacteria group bacterium]|nr:hypothetical protein [Patescibacteria group bacterium]